MTLAIRLSPELEQKLENISHLYGLTKSEVVKKSLVHYLEVLPHPVSPYDVGVEFFGKRSSHHGALSHSKKILKEKIRAKNIS